MRDRTEYSSESNLQQRNNSLSLPPKVVMYLRLMSSFLFYLFLVIFYLVLFAYGTKRGGKNRTIDLLIDLRFSCLR